MVTSPCPQGTHSTHSLGSYIVIHTLACVFWCHPQINHTLLIPLYQHSAPPPPPLSPPYLLPLSPPSLSSLSLTSLSLPLSLSSLSLTSLSLPSPYFSPPPTVTCSNTEASVVSLMINCQVMSTFSVSTSCSFDSLSSQPCKPISSF